MTAPDPARLHQSSRQLEGDGGRVDVEELEGLLAAATPGPWARHPDVPDEILGRFKPATEGDDYPDYEGIDVAQCRTPIPGTMGGESEAEFANAALIVEAVNALPALLDLIRRQDAALTAVRELADHWEEVAEELGWARGTHYQDCADEVRVNLPALASPDTTQEA